MLQRLIHYVWFRFRPAEGWLPFWLLVGATVSGVITVIEVGWVPEDSVVIVAALFGLLMGVGLAKRPLSPFVAWFFIITYGLLIVTIHLGRLWPRLDFLLFEPAALLPFWRQNGAVFVDRVGSWIRALMTGGSSRETIVFAAGLGLLTWLLASYAGWSTFRNQKPLLGLTVMGLGVSVNMFFGDVPPFWSAIFVGLVGVLTAVFQYSTLESQWLQQAVDFSDELRNELGLYALAISAGLLTISFAIPSIPYGRIAQAFINQPAIQAAEERFETLFGGVNVPGGVDVSPGSVGGTGVLPRSYLLGNPPELYEIVMMEAEVLLVQEDGTAVPATASDLRGTHWRGLSYETYTGKGWALSEERTELIEPNETIAIPQYFAQQTLRQRIDWQRDNRLTRYSLGLPLTFADEVVAYWRGLDDLARVRGLEQQYDLTSTLSTASPDALRETAVIDIPPIILARYTALPDSVPERVHQLAQEVAGNEQNPYEQARALEQFLRQYPYSLDVELPPPDSDPVDFFLFELQSGYCDYYASAMVVMARSLGLPARLAVGYLPQPPDEDGRQTVYQINGHSWAEVYFAGYGWVEFEPTPAFASRQDDTAVFSPEPEPEPEPLVPPPPAPEVETQRNDFLWVLLLLLLMAVVLFWQRRRRQEQGVEWIYGRLHQHAQKLGFFARPGATPQEFIDQFSNHLQQIGQHRWLTTTVSQMLAPLRRLVSNFELHQYAPPQRTQPEMVRKAWHEVKRPLWLLRLLHTDRDSGDRDQVTIDN